jgi:spore protease
MHSNIRTDLALEARELYRENARDAGELPGVRSSRSGETGLTVETVEIIDSRGEAALGKPRGKYVTFCFDALLRREEDAFSRAAGLLSSEIRALLPPGRGCVLVAGLGNRAITPDAVGPMTLDSTMITRHLREQLPEYFSAFRPVAGVCSGVLGTTGVESGDLIAAVVKKLRPEAVIAVDALAARSVSRLCRTVQLSDTGIIPGSGVGNARQTLSRETLGVPVIALGVPTVVDAATLCSDLVAGAGAELDTQSLGKAGGMIVTTRDIDKNVRDAARLLGYSIDLALHDSLTIPDIDMFLS